ncbi:MAG: FAD-binding oxidoreductase [Hyphomicrobiaceae bacterium]|nr:FAD-binding oxidoreductase [Hyphomicrobiaceae bacterium]
MQQTSDIVIVGAGIVGSATAYFLSRHPGCAGQRIVLLERDRTFAEASTARSAGGLRQQFSTPENIALSQATLAMIRSARDLLGADADVAFREQGYLVLASDAGADILRENHAVQSAAGAPISLLAPGDLVRTFPWLSVDGLAVAAHGVTGEGWFDPPSFAGLMRKSARAAGVELVYADVTGISRDAGRILGVTLADGTTIAAGSLVIAAGAWSGSLAALAGVPLPIEPRKRFIYVIDCRDTPEALRAAPLTVDPSGVWFRPEGRFFICGRSPEEGAEPPAGNLSDIDHAFFETEVWPQLAARVPAFESVRVVNAWAGYYDYNTLDQNAVIGAHPQLSNLFMATGFSGHGAQQGPAAGRAIAELICDGRFTSIDLARLGYGRIAENRPLCERNVI